MTYRLTLAGPVIGEVVPRQVTTNDEGWIVVCSCGWEAREDAQGNKWKRKGDAAYEGSEHQRETHDRPVQFVTVEGAPSIQEAIRIAEAEHRRRVIAATGTPDQ